MTSRRTIGVLLGALLVLALLLGCSVSQLAARPLAARPRAATPTPVRTARPTWTPLSGNFIIASPTLDLTRFPGVTLATSAPPTPVPIVPGGSAPIFGPQAAAGGPAVQTVVVIFVTATPSPAAPEAAQPRVFVPPPKPTLTPTPAPPTATPPPTRTPLPPVQVVTKEEANVRQGPGVAYPVVTRLDAGVMVTVVGRNQAGDWWKICCVNGADVWISDALVRVEGPLWTVAEAANIPPAPTPLPATPTPAGPSPTPTSSWMFRPEGQPEEYLLGQDIFRVDAVIYNGASPLWGYRLLIRDLATGRQWFSDKSQSAGWDWTIVQWPDDGKVVGNSGVECVNPTRPGLRCIKSNLKWDSMKANTNMGPGPWDVTVVDGAGNPLSAPVRFNTNRAESKWYYVVFTSRK